MKPTPDLFSQPVAVLQRPGVTAPIIGARSLEQLESNLGAAGWALDGEGMAALDQASQVKLSYPYSDIQGWMRK